MTVWLVKSYDGKDECYAEMAQDMRGYELSAARQSHAQRFTDKAKAKAVAASLKEFEAFVVRLKPKPKSPNLIEIANKLRSCNLMFKTYAAGVWSLDAPKEVIDGIIAEIDDWERSSVTGSTPDE